MLVQIEVPMIVSVDRNTKLWELKSDISSSIKGSLCYESLIESIDYSEIKITKIFDGED